MVLFTLFSFLVSTAALVDRKIKGLLRRPTLITQPPGVDGIKTEVTDYVAVIATIPPAAPAKEWIAESPGIVEGCNGDGGDGKHDFGGSFVHHLNINKHVTSASIVDVRSEAGTSSAEWGCTILQSNYDGACTITGSSSRQHNEGCCEDAFLGECAESCPYLRQGLQKTQSINRVSLSESMSYEG